MGLVQSLFSYTFGVPPSNPLGEWPFDVTEIKAPDGSISASFVSIGATLTQLWVKDKFGKSRDVVLGYDDPSLLQSDPAHPIFNAIVGRYANRIKNGTFSIPITKDSQPSGPNVYQIPTNDHDGQVTLHGGLIGWDRRNWTLVSKTARSVTYKHIDEAHEGFPGIVTAYATHTVSNGGVLNTHIRARASQETPIMLTQHVYWNLDAFQNGVNDALEHILQVHSSKVIDLDGNAVPTGKLIDVAGTPLDFRKPQVHGARFEDMCSGGCKGYDNCWVYDRKLKAAQSPDTSLWSKNPGIRVDINTNQDAVQIYSAYWMNTARKKVHGGPGAMYGRYSGIAIEPHGLVGAINTPEWGVDHIYHPDRPYEWSTTYKFSTVK